MPDSKQLVVDASIAQSAGGRENPTSQRCSDFLVVMRDETEHWLVMTPDIYSEWKAHEAFFASTWRTSMIARKRVAFFKQHEVFDADLREKIERLEVDYENQRELLKDIHLIEAAIAADHIISSLNSKDRRRFARVCDDVDEIADIVWVNPDKSEELCEVWLRDGAPHEKERCLGFKEE